MDAYTPIRNCGLSFKFRCPKTWDSLRVTRDPGVRHCEACRKDVYLCVTDEETALRAREGRCVAREMPKDTGESEHLLGEVAADDPMVVRLQTLRREKRIDQALNSPSSQACPTCKFPIPDSAQACVVCE
ncbi:MAG TPA: hypothetical protein VF950_09660 [Planctomycetota bacterium]